VDWQKKKMTLNTRFVKRMQEIVDEDPYSTQTMGFHTLCQIALEEVNKLGQEDNANIRTIQ
jgi:hypothetical protein